jgi:hypothetical protein
MISNFVCALLILTELNFLLQDVHFVFMSDVHFGITRQHFRGQDSIDATIVNKAQVDAINKLGKEIKYLDSTVEGSDIANREEIPLQNAATSWSKFTNCYLKGIKPSPGKTYPQDISCYRLIMMDRI